MTPPRRRGCAGFLLALFLVLAAAILTSAAIAATTITTAPGHPCPAPAATPQDRTQP